MAIGVDSFDLSMVSPETGRFLSANFYTVEGVTNVDGTLRELSIGQLVMAICLKRAAELETNIIALMEEMNDTSAKLEKMTEIENVLLAYGVYMSDITKNGVVYNGTNYTCCDFLVTIVGMSSSDVPSGHVTADSTDFITALEAKMDEMNSFSQQKMIELQSLTNKRDQSYDMISNILKSLNTTMIGNVNNM
ncbi:MAG: hypothetical protein IJQ34_04250 [Kiritimatiellae bacterium]|nr:hypothetical protein [Kiritimatiellia bacterium]